MKILQCAGRKIFKSEKAAVTAAMRMASVIGERFYPVGCPKCGGYHLVKEKEKVKKNPVRKKAIKRKITKKVVRKNPIRKKVINKNPLLSKDDKIKAASILFKNFRKKPSKKMMEAAFKNPDVVIEVGVCRGILYDIPDGERKGRYLHEFSKNAAPILVASHDGKQIYLIGGDYQFTDRGITDNN